VRLTNSTNKRFLLRNIAGILAAVITLTVPFVIAQLDNHVETSQSMCPFKLLTGFPCPGCGITKSLIFLYQGDLVKSIHYHILGIPLVLFCIVIIVLLSINIITRKLYFRKWLYHTRLAYALAIFLAGYHSLRLIVFISSNNLDQILAGSAWK
jgi:hypothetical protein